MTNAILARCALLSLAVGWTAFAGMKAGDATFWASAFIGSLAALITFFWLSNQAFLAQSDRKTSESVEDEQ